MQLQFFCPRWGAEDIPWETFLEQVKMAGYDGVEWAIASGTPIKQIEEVVLLADKHDLKLIAQHYDTNYALFDRHYTAYLQWLSKILPFPWVKVNSQTGKDYFSFEQNSRLLAYANDYAARTGMEIMHETHRGKFSFCAQATKPYLQAEPRLFLTLDVSHWCCVSESLLEGQEAALQLSIERAQHIHARVGYTQGPQVPDPRLPEAAAALEFHVACWKKVAACRRAADDAVLTITPEFGPHPYMVHVPATGAPVAGQWQLNLFMMELLKKEL